MFDRLQEAYDASIGVRIDFQTNDQAAAIRAAEKLWAAGVYTKETPGRFAARVAQTWGRATNATDQQVEEMRRTLAARLDPDGSVADAA